MSKVKHIVGFSGGIDSQACARWVLNRYPAEDVLITNSPAGNNEHPLTSEFVAWYSEHVHHVEVIDAIVAAASRTCCRSCTSGRRAKANTDCASEGGMMTAVEVIEKTLILLDGGKAWTKEFFARDSAGNGVYYNDPRAVCWCIRGAIRRCCNDSSLYNAVVDCIRKILCGDSISLFNDAPSTTWPDVERALKAALIPAAEWDAEQVKSDV